MNDQLVQKVAKDLTALSNEYGKDHDGNNKVVIKGANRQDHDNVMEFLSKWSYAYQGAYSCDDLALVEEARNLVERNGQVWIVPNVDTREYELYIPPGRDQTTYSTSSASTGTSQKSGGCFIATACYGSYSSPDVLVLRRFRDQVLLTKLPGRVFVSIYYFVSPPLADFISSHDRLKKIVRVVLIDPVVNIIRKRLL